MKFLAKVRDIITKIKCKSNCCITIERESKEKQKYQDQDVIDFIKYLKQFKK